MQFKKSTGQKNLWFKIRNSGYGESVYEVYRQEIVLQNSSMVQATSFIGGIMMLLLTAVAAFVPSVSRVLPLYFFTAVLFVLCYVVNRWNKARSGHVTLLCNYGFLTAAFIFAIGLDVIQGNATATTVCVLLVALPLLIVDKPVHEFFYFLVISLCFMYESMYIKQSPKASIDILNAISFLCVGTFLGYKHNQMVLRNIQGHHMLEQERDTDALTELYNKAAIEGKAVEFLSRENVKASLMVIDMDNFKFVNDTYGHHSGDEILAAIGESLTTLFRESDWISRFGGDEFVVFLPMMDDIEVLKVKAQQILDEVKEIRITADEKYRAHICIGIATYPSDGANYEELFRNADAAMYEVKKNGKNGFGFYGVHMRKPILLVDDIEMNRAILRKTLEKDYVIFEAEDGQHALQMLEEHEEIAMVITDIQMPNMDGLELIHHVRTDENLKDKNISIIANTQYGDKEMEEKVLSMGVDDFVYKAASPGTIQKRVKNVMKSREE